MKRYYTTKESPTKRCPKCETWKPRCEFYNHSRNPSGLSAHCKECVKEKQNSPEAKLLKKLHHEKHRDKINEKQRNRNRNKRREFLELYGNKCVCCGESESIFLTIDHVKGQRGSKKKEYSNQAYYRAIKQFGSGDFRILCHNCNQASIYGECPHQRKNGN